MSGSLSAAVRNRKSTMLTEAKPQNKAKTGVLYDLSSRFRTAPYLKPPLAFNNFTHIFVMKLAWGPGDKSVLRLPQKKYN